MKISKRLIKNLFRRKNKKFITDIGKGANYKIEYDLVSVYGLDGSLSRNNELIYKFSNLIIRFDIHSKDATKAEFNTLEKIYNGLNILMHLCRLYDIDYVYIPKKEDTEYFYISTNLYRLSYLTSKNSDNESYYMNDKFIAQIISYIDSIFKKELILPTVYNIDFSKDMDEDNPYCFIDADDNKFRLSIDDYFSISDNLNNHDLSLEIIGYNIFEDDIIKMDDRKNINYYYEYQKIDKVWIIINDDIYLKTLLLLNPYISEFIILDKSSDERITYLIQISVFNLGRFLNDKFNNQIEYCMIKNTINDILILSEKYFYNLYFNLPIITSESNEKDNYLQYDCDEILYEEDIK